MHKNKTCDKYVENPVVKLIIVVILSLVIWGAMWGTIGMFLSVPLMMILLIILSQFEGTRNLAILISGDGTIISKK